MPPPSPDRLTELRRQRAMIQEHLAWLDREIKNAGGDTARTSVERAVQSPPTSPGSPQDSGSTADVDPVSVVAPELTAEANAAAEAMLDEYRVSPNDLQRDVRKGCLLYFGAALLLLVLVVGALYLALKH